VSVAQIHSRGVQAEESAIFIQLNRVCDQVDQILLNFQSAQMRRK
jgi:hypothetical protein